MNYLNSLELWPVWIGFFWFALLVTIRTIYDIGPLDLSVWSNDVNFVTQFQNTNLIASLCCFVSLTLISVMICHSCTHKKLSFLQYFIVFCIMFASKIIGTNETLRSNGFGTSFWCITIGCFIRTTCRDLDNYTLSMEFFIKVSIVLFAIDIQKIAELGPRGLVIGWIETSVVLIFVYLVGIYILRMDISRSLLISSGLSICGSSAIMAVSDVIDKRDQETNEINLDQSVGNSIRYHPEYNQRETVENVTTVAITILSIFAIPYIPILPIFCKMFNFSDNVCGVWIGGTIDSTGAVIASASLLNQNTLDSAVILKMLQNIIIGPVTLLITIGVYKSANPRILIDKFPKFVVGFLIVSGIVSSLPARQTIARDCFIASEWFSNLSFVLIGLDIDLLNSYIYREWRMVLLYIIGQSIDTFTTLGLSILLYKE